MEYLYLHCNLLSLRRAPIGFVPQNICSSANFLLAGKFGKNNMSLEGNCCWEVVSSMRAKHVFVFLAFTFFFSFTFFSYCRFVLFLYIAKLFFIIYKFSSLLPSVSLSSNLLPFPRSAPRGSAIHVFLDKYVNRI